jgi:hypothetical protein
MTIQIGTRTNLPHGSQSIACTAIAKIFQQGRKIQLDLACQQTETSHVISVMNAW